MRAQRLALQQEQPASRCHLPPTICTLESSNWLSHRTGSQWLDTPEHRGPSNWLLLQADASQPHSTSPRNLDPLAAPPRQDELIASFSSWATGNGRKFAEGSPGGERDNLQIQTSRFGQSVEGEEGVEVWVPEYMNRYNPFGPQSKLRPSPPPADNTSVRAKAIACAMAEAVDLVNTRGSRVGAELEHHHCVEELQQQYPQRANEREEELDSSMSVIRTEKQRRLEILRLQHLQLAGAFDMFASRVMEVKEAKVMSRRATLGRQTLDPSTGMLSPPEETKPKTPKETKTTVGADMLSPRSPLTPKSHDSKSLSPRGSGAGGGRYFKSGLLYAEEKRINRQNAMIEVLEQRKLRHRRRKEEEVLTGCGRVQSFLVSIETGDNIHAKAYANYKGDIERRREEEAVRKEEMTTNLRVRHAAFSEAHGYLMSNQSAVGHKVGFDEANHSRFRIPKALEVIETSSKELIHLTLDSLPKVEEGLAATVKAGEERRERAIYANEYKACTMPAETVASTYMNVKWA